MNTMIEEGLKLVATTAVGEYTKGVIDTYITPLLKSRYNEIQSDKKIFLIKDSIDEYMRRTYNNNLYMSTIVFKNQQKTLNDLYIPLTVVKSSPQNKNNEDYIRIDKYRDDFIPYYNKVLLVDNAGMGKSTVLKYLYLSAITENKGVPILIELRKLVKDISLIDFIMNEINGINGPFDKEEILSLIEGGGFIFFFDGYDEIIDEHKKEITENLQDFISKTSVSRNLNNNFIISSRDESSLGCFSDFQRFDIKPLSREEAYQLIRKYDNNGELSNELIEKLDNEENLKIIEEFLTNPLMVSLLYKAFEYKRVVPYKKQIFYRQVYDALFEDHDRTKGGAYVHPKKSKLDIEDFHKVLRALGIVTLNKGVNYYKEDLVKSISQAKRIVSGTHFKENDFIYDITHSVPLFIKDGSEYRWAHKSFQEYFAACYICFDSKEKQSQYLLKMSESHNISRYYNVLDFCYDIDYKEFRKVIIYPMLKEFIDYYKKNYNDTVYSEYNQEELDLRKRMNFINKEIYIKKIDEKTYKEIMKTKHPRDRFDKVFKSWEQYNKRVMSSLCISSNNICIGVVYNDVYRVLLKLLKSKSLFIVEDYDYFIQNMDYKDELANKIEVGEYIVDDNSLNVLNQKDIFGLVNNCLVFNMNNNIDGLYLLNYDKCIEMKNEIEEEIRFEDKSKLFL